jgi:3-phosphoshikimate 1-carboxyvinyltransferase
MMNIIVNTTRYLQGESQLPASKSYSIRAILLGALSTGESVLTNVLDSSDTEDAIHICQALGSVVTKKNNKLVMNSNGLPFHIKKDRIYTGNSGITTHFVLPLLGLRRHSEKPIIVDCGDQMRERPIKALLDALSQLGLTIEYLERDGSLPIKITGALRSGKISISISNSQPLSALLMALSATEGDSEIVVHDLCEWPYVEMTLQYLKERGIHVTHDANGQIDVFKIKGKQTCQPMTASIQADFSSASYLIAAAALLPSDVTLHGLNLSDPQGDKALISILQEMGADIIANETQLHVRGGKKLRGIQINAQDIPDLVPTLAVIGACASGKTEICHVSNARVKETDRLHSMTDGLTKMGAKIKEYSDGLTIYESKLRGSHVKGYNDHRTVMALSIAGLLAKGTTVIDDGLAINKTFPDFVDIMRLLGAKMELTNAIR